MHHFEIVRLLGAMLQHNLVPFDTRPDNSLALNLADHHNWDVTQESVHQILDADKLWQRRLGGFPIALCRRLFQLSNNNNMQPETADFAPVPPLGELDETYASSLTLAHSLHIMSKHDVIYKTGITSQHIALPPEEDRATATGNMYRKFREIRSCGL